MFGEKDEEVIKEAILAIIDANCVLYCQDESSLKKMKYYIDLYKKLFNSSYNDRIIDMDKKVQATLLAEGAGILKVHSMQDILEASVIRVEKKFVKCRVQPDFIGVIFLDRDILDLRKGDSIFVKIKKISKYNEVEFSYEGFNE